MSPACPGHLETITLCPCPSGAGEGRARTSRKRAVRELFYSVSFLFLKNPKSFICACPLGMLQDVKVFSEDGTCKVVEIPADMTARDLCQLLVYRSHCVDDNSWTLVEHHPHLGLGRTAPGSTRRAFGKGHHGQMPDMSLLCPRPHSSISVLSSVRRPLLVLLKPLPDPRPSSPEPCSWLGQREVPRAQTQREGSPCELAVRCV